MVPSELQLVPAQSSQLPQLLQWLASREDVMQWAGPKFEWPLSLANLQAHLDETQQSAGAQLPFALLDQRGTMVGYEELWDVDPAVRTGRITRFLIDPALRGRGFGRAGFALLVQHAFGALALESLSLNVFAFNAPAIRCYRSLGFAVESTKPPTHSPDGRDWSVYRMVLHRAPTSRSR